MEKPIFVRKGLDLSQLNRNSSLDTWFYDMVQKTPDSLTDFDIARMLRQDVFPDIAIPLAFRRISVNPLCGPMFEGQMMENLLDFFVRHPKEEKQTYASLAGDVYQAFERCGLDYVEDTDEITNLVIQFSETFPQ